MLGAILSSLGGGGGALSALGGIASSLFGGGVQDPTQNQSTVRNESQNSQSAQSSASTQTSGPGEFTGGIFNDVFLPSVLNAFGSVGLDPYSGPLSAGADPLQIAANQGAEQAAFGAIGQGQGIRGLAEQLISGQTLNSFSNPGFEGVLTAATRPAIQAFNESVVPQITSSAIANGAYGGSRNGIALGLAADRLGESLQDTTSNLAYQNFQTERGRQLNAGSLLNQAFGLDQQPFQTASALGAERRGFAQDQINENVQLDSLARSQPFETIGQLGQLLAMVGDRQGAGQNEGLSNSQSVGTSTSNGMQTQDAGTFGNLLNGLNFGAGAEYLGRENPGMFDSIQGNIPRMIQLGNSL